MVIGWDKSFPTSADSRTSQPQLLSSDTRISSRDISILDRSRILRYPTATMHLMYTLDAEGKRIYTLKKVVDSEVTKSAHPARFSPDDKYSRYDSPILWLRACH